MAKAWDLEAKAYSGLRWSCDRVFGHAAPSKWTETKGDKQLITKVQSIEGCEIDESARGQRLKAENCREIARKTAYKGAEDLGDKKCVVVREGTQTSVAVLEEQPLSAPEGLYEMNLLTTSGRLTSTTKYAVKSKKGEFDYTTAQSNNCEKVCMDIYGKGKGSKKDVSIIDGKRVITNEDNKGNGVAAHCTTVQKCRSYNAKDEQGKFHILQDNKPVEVQLARPWGFTQDCFYSKDGEFKQSSVVSDSPQDRIECCCISTRGPKDALPVNFYHYEDKDPNTDKFVHESKTSNALDLSYTGPENYGDMKWSYRYWKEKFIAKDESGNEHKEYNPRRYIQGRDLSACFGLNHVLYDTINPESTLTVDPFKDHIAALQCVHLTGISQRLQFIRNLMNSLSTCLVQVRTSGRGDSGACKELFTQYLCNSIWQVIRLFADNNRCVTTDFGLDVNEQSDKITDYVKGGFKSLYEGVADVQREVAQEYENAKLNDLLGFGEESIARKVCLFAFGYDWELSAKSLVDAAYTTPFSTLVQAITSSREFLTVEPVGFRPKYEYRASWIINPGCDFERYDVYLTCVGRKQLDQYPNQVNCGAVGAPSIAYTGALGTSTGYSQCDCIHLPDAKETRLVFSGRLKQNVLEDKAFHQVIDSNVRYDHLKIVLKPDRRIISKIRTDCFPQGYDDGVFYFPLSEKNPRDLVDCRVEPLSGSFICGKGADFVTGRGTAEFVDISINGKDIRSGELVFSAGEPLKIDTTIRNVGQNKCWKITFDGQSQFDEVYEGIQQYSLVTSPTSLNLRSEATSSAREIRVRRISAGIKDVSILVRFFDKNDNSLIDLDREGDVVEVEGKLIEIKEILDTKSKVVNEGQSNQVEVSPYEGGQLKLKRGDAEVAIVGVDVRRDANGVVKIKKEGVGDNIGYAEGSITILQLQRSETGISQLQQTQSKPLTIGLFHTRDSEAVGLDSCDFNSFVTGPGGKPQERRINIRIEQKPTAQTAGSSEILIRETPSQPFKKAEGVNVYTISAAITHRSGIRQARLEDCKKPNEEALNSVTGVQSGNKYEFNIFASDLDVAGKYECTIVAETGTQEKPGKQLIKFEVQCGDKDNGYGFCDGGGNCCKDRVQTCGSENQISGGLKCATGRVAESTSTAIEQEA